MSKQRKGSAKKQKKSVRKARASRTHSIEIEFSDEKVTSFGGLALNQELARRLGLWRVLEERLPERDAQYSWLEVIQAGIAGLLSGGRGSFATQDLRGDEALLRILDLKGAPEEATFWRCLAGLGEMAESGVLAEVQREWTRRILLNQTRRDLLECEGFFPIFADGTFLEGSRRREGTKHLKDRKPGLMWATIFAGPLVAAQALAKKGEGEQTLVKRMLPEVFNGLLKPLKLQDHALLLADSLHGNGPLLDEAESLGLRYVVGGRSLGETSRVLREQPECAWHDLGPNPKRGWESSAVCQCWVHCADWPEKRLLVGRRVKKHGELFSFHYGVITNLSPEDLGGVGEVEFARKVWKLYDAKGAMELGYQDLLSDLGLHHPPCQEHIRNAGFYALATLAHTIAVGVKLIGSSEGRQKRSEQAKAKRDGVPERLRVRPERGMRLWRVCRRLFAIPARVSWHARRLKIELLGVSEERRLQFERWRLNIARC